MKMLSVIVATYNRLEKLERCISTFQSTHRGRIDYEVIVALDGGPYVKETKTIADKYGAKFVCLERNSGCGYANNAGIKASSEASDCVVVANDDIWFEEATCAKLHSFLKANDRIGIVGARLLYPDGSVQHAGLDSRILHIGRDLPREHELVREDRAAVAVTSALMGISRAALREIGGFDPRYHMGYEDIDICFRARDKGLFTHYLGSACAFHDEGGTRGRSDELSRNKAWSDWNCEGHDVFFDTWSSSAHVFCHDSITFVVAATGQATLNASLVSLSKQISSRDDVVIVDSGSNSETENLVSSFGRRFRYYRHPIAGSSWPFCLEFGRRLATGCYITFLQAGDTYEASAISLLKQKINKHPSSPMMFCVRRLGAASWNASGVSSGIALPQMVVVPNCPDFFGAWGAPATSDPTLTFVQNTVSKWPERALVLHPEYVA